MKKAQMSRILSIAALLGLVLATPPAWTASVPPENLRVAFVGDFYLSTCEDIAGLVRDENADVLVLLGDLAHTSDTNQIRQWDAVWTDHLGSDFPVFACIGNHDTHMWRVPGGYQDYLTQRIQRVPDVSWTGEIGITNTVHYKGLTLVFSGVGMDTISGNTGTAIPVGSRSRHAAYVDEALSRSDSIWRIAAWHMNMAKAQVTKKGDATGWGVYESARQHGAMVFTGHCHAYARSHLISRWADPPVIASTASPVALDEGKNIVMLSSLGGQKPYGQRRNDAWWAHIYASTVDLAADDDWAIGGIEKSVAFVDFHVDGQPNKARGYYKTVSGQVIDQFTLISNVAMSQPPAAPSGLTAGATSTSGIALTWQDNSHDETGFKIDRRQSQTDDWVRVEQTVANATAYTDSGLSTDTKYYYKVKAFNDEGNSGYAGPADATTWPAGVSTFDLRIGAGNDDAEEDAASGGMYLTSSDLELVRDSGDQIVGMRFAPLSVPPGAVVHQAYVQFTVDEVSSETTSLVLHGEAADHAAPFGAGTADISSRPRTSAAVSWQPPAWAAQGDSGPAQRTPDISVLVQEVVNRPGWQAGNALSIIVTGSGHREADSYDGNPATAPLLHIAYEIGDTNANLSLTAASPADGQTVPDTRAADDPFAPHAADEDLSIPHPTRLSWQTTGSTAGVTFDVLLAETPALGPQHALDAGTTGTEVSAWNLKIDTDYYWQVVARRAGSVVAQTEVLRFRTAPFAPRWIHVDGTTNVRDVGGPITRDGHRLRQGLLFRSAKFDGDFQISTQGEQALIALGIRTEHDLRGDGTPSLDIDGLGYVRTGVWGFSGFYSNNLPTTAPLYAAAVKALAVTNRYPVILHCTHGADRTGVISFLIEALLGCSEEEIFLDYEWTTLSLIGERNREFDKFQNAIGVLRSYDAAGASLQVGVSNFLLANGVSQTELDAIRDLLLDTRPQGRVPKHTAWKYLRGTTEASVPATAWHGGTPAFDDSGWSTGEAPFGYSSDGTYGTTLADMRYTYTSLFLRNTFTIQCPAAVSRLELDIDYDDGFIVWINGQEIARVNVQGASGEFIPHNTTCAGYVSAHSTNWTTSLSGPELPPLRTNNVLAVQVFNNTLHSSDLMFDAELAVADTHLPVSQDNDQDAMPDAWEQAHLSDLSDPADRSAAGDPDGDGISNLEEYIAGTNPLLETENWTLETRLQNGQVQVRFTARTAAGPGYDGLSRHYCLEHRLRQQPDSPWSAVPGYADVLGAGQEVVHIHSSADRTANYRARTWLE